MKAGERWLIVNADDFGLSDGVNRGIVRAHEHGIVTSASLMVRQPGAPAAADYARGRAALGVGLHLDFGEWEFRDGTWKAVYEVVPVGDADELASEVERQFTEFVRLMGRPPTHLDSHQHVHRDQPLRGIATALAARLHIPLRSVTPGIRYLGDFYGQGRNGSPAANQISPDSLIAMLEALPEGITELGCHPGDDPVLASAYRTERLLEVQTLCDNRVGATLERLGIRTCHFGDDSLRSIIA